MAESDNTGSAPKPAGHAPKPPAEMAVEPWEDELTRELAARFGTGIGRFGAYLGQPFLTAAPGSLIEILQYLKERAGFDFLTDLTVVDYPQRERRFELVCLLYSFGRNIRIRVKAAFAESERAPSLTAVYPAADWLEREVFDMFGIEFDGHPGLRRLLLPDEWQGFPLRKDSSILGMDQRWVRENLGIESGQ
jgi:NADH-quinone oxidoreductase subunit C